MNIDLTVDFATIFWNAAVIMVVVTVILWAIKTMLGDNWPPSRDQSPGDDLTDADYFIFDLMIMDDDWDWED